jgi:hypothetical protein
MGSEDRCPLRAVRAKFSLLKHYVLGEGEGAAATGPGVGPW